MPKRSTGFQKLVALIHASLHDGTIQESAMMIDKVTGDEREVDLLISKEVSGYRIYIAVEVIDRIRKADSTWVEGMCGKHQDLETNKLILVSRSGFYRPALVKAQHHGVEAITLSQASETDWELAIRMTSQGFFQFTTTNYKTTAQLIYPDGRVSKVPIATSVTVYLPYQDTPTDVEKMVHYFLDLPELSDKIDDFVKKKLGPQSIKLAYTTERGTHVLDEDGSKVELQKLWVEMEIEGYYTPIQMADGRYKDRDVAYGISSNSEDKLMFVIVRDEQGDHGMLLHKKGLRTLTARSR